MRGFGHAREQELVLLPHRKQERPVNIAGRLSQLRGTRSVVFAREESFKGNVSNPFTQQSTGSRSMHGAAHDIRESLIEPSVDS